jgi:hypothetical protein
VDDIWGVEVDIGIPVVDKPILYMATRFHMLQHNRLLTRSTENINPKTLDDDPITGFIECNMRKYTSTHLENRLAVEKQMHFNWLLLFRPVLTIPSRARAFS